MSKEENQLAADQILAIERCKKSAVFHRELAEICSRAGLPILARENDFQATNMEEKVAMQIGAFRDNSLLQSDPVPAEKSND